jgi:putative transposase
MQGVLRLVLDTIVSLFRARYGLHVENLALRHQLCVYQRSVKRPTILPVDRALWSLLARMWDDWKQALVFVTPETVIRWQRKRFKDHWTKLSRQGKPGRPPLPNDLQELIRTMSRMNPTWGSPRIVGELAALGIHVSKSAVEKYMVSVRKPPSPTWRSFLENHARELVSIDLLVVHTVNFRVLYALILLSIERRRIIHVGVAEHPTAAWAAQQVIEAFPWETSPRYLLRDRDGIYGQSFRDRVKHMGIEEVLTAPRSPWQNPYSERLNGSIRRECLDHMIVLSERHLGRLLRSYVDYYNRYRTHLSLDMDSPDGRQPQKPLPGQVIAVPHLGGLHHHYERQAA